VAAVGRHRVQLLLLLLLAEGSEVALAQRVRHREQQMLSYAHIPAAYAAQRYAF